MAKSTKGVLSHLCMLETQANNFAVTADSEEDLKATLEALLIQRDQLKARVTADTSLQKVRDLLDKDASCGGEGVDDLEDGSENLQLLLLMAKHVQLKDLLNAHHLTGGYDVIRTREGVCVSLATAYDGVYLETYNLEINMKANLRIRRHNIPPFIPLERLVQQSHIQTDIRGFLDTLSQYLNAYSGRKQQLRLVKELCKSVQVMESNALCSILVLLVTVQGKKAMDVLCTLEYTDHMQYLPTRVNIDAEGEGPTSPQWKENSALLLETPVHTALLTMRKKGSIA